MSWLDTLLSGVSILLANGTALPQTSTLNFGSGLTATWNASANRVDLTSSGGGSVPTGTGFVHVTSGAQDAAARAVALNTSDVTGLLSLSNLQHGVSAGQIPVTNAGASNSAWISLSGDSTMSSLGVVQNVGILGQALPSLSVGAIVWNGSAWIFDLATALVPGTADQLLDTNHAGSAVEWFTVGGDLSYVSHAFTVQAIQGNTVSAGALTKGTFLIAAGTSSWAPTALSGDVSASSVTPGLTTVTALQGHSVAGGALVAGQLLIATSTTAWGNVTMGGDLLPGASAGQYTVSSAATGVIVFGNTFVQVGTTGVASSGDIRLVNAHNHLVSRNAAATQDMALVSSDASNRILLGGTNGSTILVSPGGTTVGAYDATGIQLFNGLSLDFGASAAGVLAIGNVGLTAPTGMPSSSVAIWNSAQALLLACTGVQLSSVVTTSPFAFTWQALASTTGATTAGKILQFAGQAGQAGTSGANGATGGQGGSVGGAGGSSDTGAGGTGGAGRTTGGAGGAATAGSGNGGQGGNAVVSPGVGGTSAGGSAGADGLTQIFDHVLGTALFAIGQAGYGGVAHTVTVATSGSTTLAIADYKFPVLRLGTISLTNNATIVFPNSSGQWWVDTSGVSLNAHTLTFSSGSATASITPSTTAPFLVLTFGGNTLLVK